MWNNMNGEIWEILGIRGIEVVNHHPFWDSISPCGPGWPQALKIKPSSCFCVLRSWHHSTCQQWLAVDRTWKMIGCGKEGRWWPLLFQLSCWWHSLRWRSKRNWGWSWLWRSAFFTPQWSSWWDSDHRSLGWGSRVLRWRHKCDTSETKLWAYVNREGLLWKLPTTVRMQYQNT